MEGVKHIEITVAPHVVRALEEEAEILDSTPADIVEGMVREWVRQRSWRIARINQVEMQRQMAADAEASGETPIGGCK